MTLYIITVSDVYDFVEYHHEPIVKLTKKEALKKLSKLKKSAQECYEGQFDHMDSSRDSFSFFPEGYWGTSHYDACISKVEVPGIQKHKKTAK